ALVEIGLDRMHHAFWNDQDAILVYLRHVDGLVARLVAHADDETTVLVVSDHGAKRLEGGIRVHEGPRRAGAVRTPGEPGGGAALKDVGVDWNATTAWGEGGYYARVFLNVQGREPTGSVAPEDYERVRADLAERIAAIPGPDGEPLTTRVFRPEDVYEEVNGV